MSRRSGPCAPTGCPTAPNRARTAEEWPLAPAVLRTGVDVTEDVDLSVDVRRTPVVIELTMNGGPIPWPEDPPWSFDRSPWFRIGPDSDLFRVLGIWRASSGAPPPIDRFEGYLVPGTYRLGTGLYFGYPLRAEGQIPTTGADLGCWIVPE